MPVIHFRHCKRSVSIQGCAFRAVNRHGLRPREDEGILVNFTCLKIQPCSLKEHLNP